MSHRIKSGISPKIPEIGKIKIGMKNENEKREGGNGSYYLPKKLEHFIIVKPERNADKINYKVWEELQNKIFIGKDGKICENPTEIPCMLPFDDPTLNFMTSFAWYDSRRCKCRGDGETAEMIFDADGKPKQYIFMDKGPDEVKKGDKRIIKCNYETCPNAIAKKCKPNGILRVIIPDSGYLNGFFAFRSTSWNTISFLTAALDNMLIQTNGIMAYLPAKLKTFEKYTESHGNVRVVTIDWDMDQIRDMVKIVHDEKNRRLSLGIDIKRNEQLAITSGSLEDEDDPGYVTAEWYPENTEEYKAEKQKIESDITERSSAILGGVENVSDIKTVKTTVIGVKPEEKQPVKESVKEYEDDIGGLFDK